MNKLKQHQSQMDFGFYATIPRIVRTEYPQISPAQKWFYVCLKDLSGDDGICYRTIRALAKETGLSCGLISESIPILHTAGLIHAEKKKRQTGGKEVWHLTIVEIWQKNGEVHPTRRSSNEQVQDIHRVNAQEMNTTLEECSAGEHTRSFCEHECSPAETEERTRARPEGKNISEGRTEEVRRISFAVPHAASASPPASADRRIIQLDARRKSSAETAAARVALGGTAGVLAYPPSPETNTVYGAGNEKPASVPELSTTSATYPHSEGKPGSRRSTPGTRAAAFQASLEAALSEQARAIYVAWCSLFTVPMPLTPATAKAAEALVKPLAGWCSALNKTLAELLKEIMHWLYATDKTGYYQRGVKLSDVAREFEGWQSAKERARHTSDEGTASLPEKGEVFWRGCWMSYAEADDQGWNGGFGEFVHHMSYA